MTDLLHLLDGARQLGRALVGEPLRQRAQDGRLGGPPRADHKREAEARLVFRVEARHARDLDRVQRVQSGLSLLLLRLPGQAAALEVSPREVRVASEDPLFTWTKRTPFTHAVYARRWT